MSRSYRKILKVYPAHCKASNIGRLSWKKTFRREINRCVDEDGTPVLPAKISRGWPLSRGGGMKGGFGYDTYTQRVYSFRMIGGKPVSSLDPDEKIASGQTVGQYMAKQFRSYKNK